MPLAFPSLSKWFIAVVPALLLTDLAPSTAQEQTLLTGVGPHSLFRCMRDGIAEFQKLHPDIEIEYNAIRSGAGISGKLQLAFTISERVTDRWMRPN
jgi:ABC-type phosphate transport system substrate-binding protein